MNVLVWLRRDLRLHDNTALHHALKDADRVFCGFCFDREILDKLEDSRDRRVEFIGQSLVELDERLRKYGSRLIVRHGMAREEIPQLADALRVDKVYANHDYEPNCIDRDDTVRASLTRADRTLKTFKDQVVFEKDEVLTKAGTPYRVFTQYRNAWRANLTDDHLTERYCRSLGRKAGRIPRGAGSSPWGLGDLGFEKTDLRWPGGTRAGRRLLGKFLGSIDRYAKGRDVPAADATSHLSVHLRFGTLSIRELMRAAFEMDSPGAQKWIDELIWREFFNAILHHFPHVEHEPFQERFDALAWKRDRRRFRAWCEGQTGYPIVDAGMRQLNTTGFMHNRLRMVTASFLTKDLLIDWKWGERYFASKLLDFDLSQNLGGWQWSASIGVDAQPYFRIFNPVSQSKRFDPNGAFIRQHVPELDGFSDRRIHAPWEASAAEQDQADCRIGKAYPAPIVDHAIARKAALRMFSECK